MLWDSRGAAQVKASIGQMQAGMSNYKRELAGVNNEQSMLNKQMKAFGTTLRYALAGGAIFGTINAITKLGDFQAKLGNISAIGANAKYPLVGKQLDDLGNQIIKMSTDTITPVNQLQDAVTNLYSTVDNISPDTAVKTIEVIAKAARISQADITDTTQAVLGMMNAFDKGMTDIPKLGAEFFTVTKYASGGADFARIYAQQLGNLSKTARQGGFTVEQMSALAIAGSKFAGSPAANLRAQSQLQRTILTPSNKKSEAYYEQAGVGKMARRQMDGFEVLNKILTYANTLETGKRREFIAGAFTRAESRGIAQLLTGLVDKDKLVPGTKLRSLDQYLGLTTRGQSVKEFNEAYKRVLDRSAIQQAGMAMQNTSLAAAADFNPLINPLSRGIVKANQGFQKESRDHPNIVAGVIATAGAGLLAARLFGKGGRFAGRLGGAGMLAAAAEDAATGGKVRGDSPFNPLYVVMVSELLGRGRGFGQYGKPIGPLTEAEAAAEKAARTGSKAGRLGRFFSGAKSFGKNAYGLAGLAPLAKYGVRVPLGLGALAMADVMAIMSMPSGGPSNNLDEIHKSFPRLSRLVARGGKGFPFEKMSPVEQQAIRSLGGYSLANAPQPRLKAAEAMMDNAVKAGLNGKITGHATVTVNIDQTDAKGNVARKVTKVPLPMFGSFTGPAPQTAGKNKTTRGK
jgi:hypothetical protein